MSRRFDGRLDDILDAIEQIELLISPHSLESLARDRFAIAALERFVEIISEASRHIPSEMTGRHRDISWRGIADIGNHLRHGYNDVDLGTLWDLAEKGHLDALKRAVLAMKTG